MKQKAGIIVLVAFLLLGGLLVYLKARSGSGTDVASWTPRMLLRPPPPLLPPEPLSLEPPAPGPWSLPPGPGPEPPLDPPPPRWSRIAARSARWMSSGALE